MLRQSFGQAAQDSRDICSHASSSYFLFIDHEERPSLVVIGPRTAANWLKLEPATSATKSQDNIFPHAKQLLAV
jgi:hypothetical protein